MQYTESNSLNHTDKLNAEIFGSEECPPFVFSGLPGAGKTTLIEYIARIVGSQNNKDVKIITLDKVMKAGMTPDNAVIKGVIEKFQDTKFTIYKDGKETKEKQKGLDQTLLKGEKTKSKFFMEKYGNEKGTEIWMEIESAFLDDVLKQYKDDFQNKTKFLDPGGKVLGGLEAISKRNYDLLKKAGVKVVYLELPLWALYKHLDTNYNYKTRSVLKAAGPCEYDYENFHCPLSNGETIAKVVLPYIGSEYNRAKPSGSAGYMAVMEEYKKDRAPSYENNNDITVKITTEKVDKVALKVGQALEKLPQKEPTTSLLRV
ncbi:MAG: hypothetical protein AAF195_01530 [Pseudomonadota bacterium]